MRKPFVGLCRLLLRIFFRRVEIAGEAHVPKDGAVVFVLNHPSGLIDPLFILCRANRKVSFLAKEPLFRMPLIGMFVKAFECLPVYRTVDGADPKKNRQMLEDAVALLKKGNALALFPEGTSHSDPTLKELRTGAARIALGARAVSDDAVWLVPAGLYYEEKDVFRSRAVLAYGPPIAVDRLELADVSNLPKEAVRQTTRAIEEALTALIPTAETVDGLVLAEKAERILHAGQDPVPSLNERMAARRRLLDAYQRLISTEPSTVQNVLHDVEQISRSLAQRGLPVDAPLGSQENRAPLRPSQLRLFLESMLLLPIWLVGALVHYPTHSLVRVLAFRYAGESTDVVATGKLLGGLLLYPLTWLLLASGAAFFLSDLRWFLLILAGPPLALLTLRFQEMFGLFQWRRKNRRFLGSSDAQWTALSERRQHTAAQLLALTKRSETHPAASPNV